MRLLLVGLTFFGFTANLSASSLANHGSEYVKFEGTESIFPVRISPCNYWQYSSDARGYVCSSTGSSMQVVEARDIQALERRIRALENRIAELEAQ